MTTRLRKNAPGPWLLLYRLLRGQRATKTLIFATRAALFAAITAGIMMTAPTQSAQQGSSTDGKIECQAPKVDLAFLLDSSGSLDSAVVGQAYNVQIEGVLRALRDPSVIARDGSVAVAVETFASSATIQVPLRQIDSAADAEAIANIVEGLKCPTITCDPTGSCPVFGPLNGTFYAPAIETAGTHLAENHRFGARRALLLSTDGKPADLEFAAIAAKRAGDTATELGVPFKLDIILLTLDPFAMENAKEESERAAFEAFSTAKGKTDQVVYPRPPDDMPGRTLPIKNGDSNKPCASVNDSAVKADFDRQVRDFVELTHRVLRSQGATRFVTVTNAADTDPNTPVIGDAMSLRQAIERANSNGGATTIRFDPALKGKAIRPRVPLPALTAPDTRICGCDEKNCDYLRDPEKKCDPFLTIDGTDVDTTKGEQHRDGIVIRSDRAVIRSLAISNFAGAGVRIEPICNRGFSRIELNRFENNKHWGVVVLESPADPNGPFERSGVTHNVGNTISMNDILGSETPIDLAGDGPTQNDPGDPDVGPNTLLNFPDKLSVGDTLDVTATANGVSLTGQLSGPTAAGATVEIFAIESFLQTPGGRVINGVTFIKQVTANDDGSFSATDIGDSPTCGYTATVTDEAGNTSELMLPCGGFPKAKVTNPDFGEAAPNESPRTGSFSIENTGCAPLRVSFASIRRDDFPQRSRGEQKRSDDRERFSIESIIVGDGGQTITIQPGEKQILIARFDPAIPPVFTGQRRASLVLPDIVRSTLTLDHDGCAGSDFAVRLTARVKRNVLLIDPDKPRNNPLVTLNRSGDVFTVVFSIYDSNQDVDSVTYEFFDRDRKRVDLNQPDRDLSGVIQQARASGALVIGQSFRIMQKFTNALEHKGVKTVTVTVSDKGGFEATASSSTDSFTLTASARSLPDADSPLLAPPVARFETVSDRKARRTEGAIRSSATHQRRTSVRTDRSRTLRAPSHARDKENHR